MESSANIGQDQNIQEVSNKSATLIFVGITGCGKSTLIQSIKDYLDENPYKDKGKLVLNGTSTKSQTQEIKEESLMGMGWNIKVVDTPGLADTNGKQRDIIHFDELAKFLAENTTFNAICFVLKNGSCRLTPELKYAFQKLKILFPEYNENFFVLLTHSEEESHSKDADAVIKGLGLQTSRIFYFNNIAYQEFVDIDEDFEQERKVNYSDNLKAIEKLLEVSSKMKTFTSDGRIWLEKRKFSLMCQIGEEIIMRDSTYYEKAQILDMQQKISQQLIARSDCKIQRVAMLDYDIGEKATTHVVCLICSKFCREATPYEKKREIDFSNYLVQWYKYKFENKNLGFIATILRNILSTPIFLVGLHDLINRHQCRHCSCPPVYHAKFGKIEQDEYQHKDDKDKKPKFGKKLIIYEEVNIFQGPDITAQIDKELQNLEAKRNQCQEDIKLKYGELNNLKLIGSAFIYEIVLELEMKNKTTILGNLKDLVKANNGNLDHIETSMKLKKQFLTEICKKDDQPQAQQV